MLTRLLALLAVLLLAPASAQVHANARALSLENASLGFFTPNRDFLKEIPDLSHCCIKEKSTERAESSNRREEYLRARYMVPSQGRFLGMDPWSGNARVSPSLHRYQYAWMEPIGNIDPSGEVTLIDLSQAQRIAAQMILQGIRDRASDAIVNSFVNGLLSNISSPVNLPSQGNSAGAGLVMGLVLSCKSSKGKCLLQKIPTFVSGREFVYSSAHIFLSQFGNGTTSDKVPKPLPFILAKGIGRDDVDPRRGKPGCPGDVKAFVCDEYPYASTMQGGQTNYDNGFVSLQWVPKVEGPRQGNYLGRFYRNANVLGGTAAGIFLNVALPTKRTGFVSRFGKWRDL